MINLALVIGQLSFGGAEKQQLYELVIRLDRTKFNPIVFCLSEKDEPYGEKLRQQNIKVHLFKRRGHFDIFRLFKLAYLFKKEKIDIVHAMLFIAVAYSYAACKLAGIKNFVASVLGYSHRESFLIHMIDTLALNSAQKVITNSADLKDYVVENMKVNPAKVVVIRNGIEVDIFRPSMAKETVRKEIGIADCKKIVGIISRNNVAKNIPLFIESAKSLLEMGEGAYFVLIGTDLDERKKNLWLADFPYKDNFFFLGQREDIPALLSIFDIFVLTSITEGLPNVIMEAMAAGKPVVATDVGGCGELVLDGKTGFLVPSNDKDALVKSVAQLLHNENLAITMGKEGKNFVGKNFTMRKMIQTTEELYLGTVAKQ